MAREQRRTADTAEVRSAFAGRAVWIVLSLLLIGVALRASHPISNPDFGWHVALGRFVLEHASVPALEPFTHTAAGNPMVAHQWLSQMMYAVTVDSAGVLTLRVANGLLAAAVVALLFGWLRRVGSSAEVAVFGAATWAVIAGSRLQLRPHMWNLAFFVAAWGALFVLKPRLSARQIAGFFAGTVLWVNLHSGALLFAALTVLYALTSTVEQKILGREPRADEPGGGSLARLWSLAVALGLAVFITPNHLRLIPYALESRRINADLSLEWLSIASPRAIAGHGGLELTCLFALMLGVAACAWLRRREVSLAHLAVVLAVAALPFAGQRFTWTSFVPLLFVVETLATRRPSLARTHGAGSRGFALGALLLVGFAYGDEANLLRIRNSFGPSGNFRSGVFPVASMSLLARVPLQGRLFNGNKWGGYVLFRTGEQYPVFIDGRWVTIGESVIRDAQTISLRRPGYESKLRDYRIELLLVHRGWMTDAVRQKQREEEREEDREEEKRGWLPIFENFNSGLYLRAGPHLEQNLRAVERYYARQGIPFDRERGFIAEAAATANPRWARAMGVMPRHLDQFGHHGARALSERPAWVEGW